MIQPTSSGGFHRLINRPGDPTRPALAGSTDCGAPGGESAEQFPQCGSPRDGSPRDESPGRSRPTLATLQALQLLATKPGREHFILKWEMHALDSLKSVKSFNKRSKIFSIVK